MLADRAGLQVDRAGRVEVLPDLSLPGHPEVLAIGDMIRIRQPDNSSEALPGLAPVAMQEGRHAARVVRSRIRGRPVRAFRYHDKGNLATIGRASAVAEIKFLRLSGFVAWLTWLTVHLWYLIGFENRLLVLIRWAFSFLTHGRGARLITERSGAIECTRADASRPRSSRAFQRGRSRRTCRVNFRGEIMQSKLLPLTGRDPENRLRNALSEQVVFHSPVRDYHGRADVAHILMTIGAVLDEIEVESQLVVDRQVVTLIRTCPW